MLMVYLPKLSKIISISDNFQDLDIYFFLFKNKLFKKKIIFSHFNLNNLI